MFVGIHDLGNLQFPVARMNFHGNSAHLLTRHNADFKRPKWIGIILQVKAELVRGVTSVSATKPGCTFSVED